MAPEGEGPWPTWPDGCPPDHARSVDGDFYRLVDGSDRDWKSHAMLGKERPPKVPLCDWYGLSVFSSLADAESLRRTLKRFRKHRIVALRITPSMGLLCRDKPESSHHNWWPSQAVVPPPADVREVS